MCNRMGAGLAPAAWRGAPTSGQGKQLYQKRHIDIIMLGMQMQLRMGCATGWGQSVWDVQRHLHRAKTMPTAGSRYNRAVDADAIAHGMSTRAGAGPTPTAWRCAAALGQGAQLCHKWAVETTVPRMQMQLCMGCATAWGQGQHLPHGRARLHQGRASNCAKNGI